jgi:hypothetical protein
MKIAVLIPVHRDPKIDFMTSLARVLIRTPQVIPDATLEIFVRSSSMIAFGRNVLVGFAREWAADFILWADDDHAFPPDTLVRLLAHKKDVVGCNFLRRSEKATPTASRDGKPVWTTRAKAQGGLEEVDHLGLGLCLMRTAVLNGLPEPLFATDMATTTGEDVILCRKLRAAGTKIHVDHALSWESRHIADFGLGFHLTDRGEDTNADSVSSPARHQQQR